MQLNAKRPFVGWSLIRLRRSSTPAVREWEVKIGSIFRAWGRLTSVCRKASLICWICEIVAPRQCEVAKVFVVLAFITTSGVSACWGDAQNLPRGLTRFNPAGLPLDWEYVGVGFRALRSSGERLATAPVIRLRHPRRGYLLTVNESEATQAVEKGFSREKVAFHVPTQYGIPIYRFRNPTDESLLYTPVLQEGLSAGLRNEGVAFLAFNRRSPNGNDGVTPFDLSRMVNVEHYRNRSSGLHLFTADRETDYQVGAFYFGYLSSGARQIIAGTARVYGRYNDWWGGVKDFYGQEPGVNADRRGWSGEWRHLKPVIGYYNVQSVAALEKQIRQASEAGLSFFSFYWYWSDRANGEYLGDGLHSFLKAKNAERMKFNLTLFAHPWENDMAIGPGNARSVVRSIVGYFEKTNYLRLPNGRPVFFIGDSRNIRNTDSEKCPDLQCAVQALRRFVLLLKVVSVEAIGIEPFVQIQVGVPGWDAVPDIDGVACHVPPLKIGAGTPYPNLGERAFTTLARAGKPASPCMLQNFDERPRQDIRIKDRTRIRYLKGKSDALFRHNLSVAKRFSDEGYAYGHHPASRIIYLYAWNEWHEGGILEPNVETGARDLNIVSDVFQLPRSFSPCLDQGTC